MKRIGPQMRAALRIVEQNPGCTKLYVAERITPLRRYGVGSKGNQALGYNPVNRAIKAGLIRAERAARGAYALFA